MHGRPGIDPYLRSRLEACTPVGVVVMLYEGAIRFAREAAEAIEARDFARKGERIGRTLRIVEELDAALDTQAAPELVDNIRSLYAFVQRELLEASLSMKTEPIDNAIRILDRLLQSWREIDRQQLGVPESDPHRIEPATEVSGSRLVVSA